MNDLLTSLPDWALTDEAQAWWLGFGAMALVRVFRAALRWFRKIGEERID